MTEDKLVEMEEEQTSSIILGDTEVLREYGGRV